MDASGATASLAIRPHVCHGRLVWHSLRRSAPSVQSPLLQPQKRFLIFAVLRYRILAPPTPAALRLTLDQARDLHVSGLALDVPFGIIDFVEIIPDSAVGRVPGSDWFDFPNLAHKISPTAGTDYFLTLWRYPNLCKIRSAIHAQAWTRSAGLIDIPDRATYDDGAQLLRNTPVLQIVDAVKPPFLGERRLGESHHNEQPGCNKESTNLRLAAARRGHDSADVIETTLLMLHSRKRSGMPRIHLCYQE